MSGILSFLKSLVPRQFSWRKFFFRMARIVFRVFSWAFWSAMSVANGAVLSMGLAFVFALFYEKGPIVIDTSTRYAFFRVGLLGAGIGFCYVLWFEMRRIYHFFARLWPRLICF